MLNRAELIGHLGQDPVLRDTPGGLAVCNFNIATTEKWTDKKTNKTQESTEWHRIVVFDKLAKICDKFLCKGKQVFIAGRLQTRKYVDKEGIERYITEIVAREMKMLGKKDHKEDDKKDDKEDDIPF